LPIAGSKYRPLIMRKVQTIFIPFQIAKREDLPGFSLLTGNDALVADFEHVIGEHPTPMRHDSLILSVKESQVVKIVGIRTGV
jgi:hypothetical protein